MKKKGMRLVLLGLLFPAGLGHAGNGQAFSWRQDPASVALLKGTQEIWRFRYGKDEAKPAFHPVSLPDGPVLSCYRNEDHPWHRGMWFCWKFINGVNYWEEDKAGLSEGRTEASNVKVETRKNHTARITLDVAYHPPDAKPVLTEKRTIEVSAPDAHGAYYMDWTLAFQAQEQDVLLDRTPIPGDPQGKPHGGYAGLALRFDREMSDIQVMTSNGPVSFPEQGYRGIRTKADAADYSGMVQNKLVGVAFLSDPRNPNAPSPWWIIDLKAMKYFNPSVLCFGPMTLKAGQSMTLRYRALIHFGRWDAERLRAEAGRYANAR